MLDVLGIINSTHEEQFELIKLGNNMLERSFQFHNDLITALVKFLDSKNETIKTGSAQILFYVANNSTESVELLVQNGAILPLINIFRSNSDKALIEISLHILNIIIQNDFQEVDEDMKSKIASGMIEFLEHKPSDDLLIQSMDVIGGIIKSKHFPLSFQSVKKFLPNILMLLKHPPNSKVTSKSVFALAFLTSNHRFTFGDDVLIDLLQLLQSKDESAQRMSLWVLTNIVKDQQIQLLFNHRILESMEKVLKNPLFENILISTSIFLKLLKSEKHFDKIVESPAFSIMVKFYESDDIRIKSAIEGILTVVVANGNSNRILLFHQKKLFPVFCDLLIEAEKSANEEVIFLILAGTLNIISKAEEQKCLIFGEYERYGAIDVFQRLIFHENIKIQEMAYGIMHFYELHNAQNTCYKLY
uniref:Importin subunit alpha n=1 Tax=Panagrolaimus sp. ES5 TaxID=591445 RepID=A0AC34FLB2_9BILA